MDGTIKKKRGRKPKANETQIVIQPLNTENVVIMAQVEQAQVEQAQVEQGQVEQGQVEQAQVEQGQVEQAQVLDVDEESPDESNLKTPKKRGRKPKGGKIIVNSMFEETNVIHEPNIILHLKCKFADLDTNNLAYDFKGVDSFQFEKNKGSELGYHVIDNHISSIKQEQAASANSSNYDSMFKSLCNKLKNMSYNLQNNNISDKKSDCFWCTCSFDNPPIYIPKYQINNIYQCYGCFCSPECATAFLFKESIDTSTRFERYYLLNHIYNKVYNYTKNIKPAPDPYYTLNKYYGDLSIQEYRRLFKSERLLIVVDKPLSRVLPELHEYNDDIMVQDNLQNTGKFKIKRKTKQNKVDILNETFNIQ